MCMYMYAYMSITPATPGIRCAERLPRNKPVGYMYVCIKPRESPQMVIHTNTQEDVDTSNIIYIYIYICMYVYTHTHILKA